MKQKNLLFRIFLVIFLVAVAGIIGLLVRDHIQKDKDQKLREKAAVSVQEEPVKLVFATKMKQNY